MLIFSERRLMEQDISLINEISAEEMMIKEKKLT